MLHRLFPAVAVMALLTIAACESTGSTTQPTTRSAALGVVNDACPISGAPVDPAAGTVSYGGYDVGFCCAACPGAWEDMVPADRAAFVEKAMSSAASVSPGAMCGGCGEAKGSPECCK
ncbi:MAG: hypothetical protein HKO59_07540 [Phycisphaerales bacterium]|nr:hypothetical protein [Phycisphaerales bacterium]NNM25829.1 hypothetical protein [Phycisphaerales bacterium]